MNMNMNMIMNIARFSHQIQRTQAIRPNDQ
jgi:hypothetical protein